MAAKMFNTLRQKHRQRRAYTHQVKTLLEAIDARDAGLVAPLYARVESSPLFDGEDAERILKAALKRDDPPIFYAVLPGKNPNRNITLTGGGFVRDEPLLSAAILLGSREVAGALANDPATNILRRGRKTLSSLLATPVTHATDVPEALARKAGLDGIAKTLRRRHAELLARPMPAPAQRAAS